MLVGEPLVGDRGAEGELGGAAAIREARSHPSDYALG